MRFKIHHKLFIAILVANMVLASSIFLLSNWSFSQSFKQYLDLSQAKKLDPLVVALAGIYQQEQNWDWVKSRSSQRWPELMRQYVFKRPPAGPPKRGPAVDHGQPPQFAPSHRPPQLGHPPPPTTDPMAINRSIMLADSKHQLIIGPPDKKNEAYWLPIIVNGVETGYLGFFRTTTITGELDQLFIKTLQKNFSWIVLGMILLSALIALPFSRQIVRPIKKLKLATHKLASGNYKIRIKDGSRDEIGELGRDFNQLAETLSKNLKARQQWIADISHELRTPVAILQGELEALQDGVRTLSDAAVNSLHQEVLRLSHLINDLHQLSLSDLGALSYRKETLSLVDIIEDVIDSKADQIREKKIVLQYRHPEKDILVTGDYQRLTQLFYNLLNNSLSYTADNGSITINVSRSNSFTTINWADSEPGVSDAEINRLFERLYRTESSRNRNSGGSGLGLAISKNIVEAHQGHIVASHSASGGLCFSIELPLLNHPRQTK